MSQPKPYVRVTLTEEQRRSRLRGLIFGLGVCVVLLVVLVVAATAWFEGLPRWALLVSTLVPLTVALLALRGILVLARAPRRS